jgi:hypothetical protein
VELLVQLTKSHHNMNRNATATIAIVLAAGIYFTFTSKLINEVKAVREVNSQYISAIANAEQLLSVRESTLKAYNSISEDDRLKLEKMVPDNVDNIRLVIDLKAVGARHGFNIQGIKAAVVGSVSKQPAAAVLPSTADNQNPRAGITSFTPVTTPETINVSFELDAPYLEFISFLQDIEANLRIMDITHLSVTVNDTGQYHFIVELKTYWLKK